MIRILHVVGKMNRAGAETMIMNLYRNINLNKVQFDFLYFTNERTYYDEEIEKLGGKIYRLSNSGFIANIGKLKALLSANPNIKVVHCHTALSSFAYLIAARISKVPMRIVHSHSSKSREDTNFTYKMYERFSKLMIDKFATHFISCGSLASKYLFPKKGSNEILVVPNAIDVNHFFNIGQNHQNYLREQYSISDDTIILLQVGRFLPVKNHKFSLELAMRLKEMNKSFKLFFAGTGELKEEIEILVTKYNLADNVIFLGDRSDIAQLMAGSDILLMPSIHEGFPLVLVEAQAVGLRSIVSSSVSSEVDLYAGLVNFKNLNVDEWVKEIQNSTEINKLDSNLRLKHIFERGFDIKQTSEMILNLYTSIDKKSN